MPEQGALAGPRSCEVFPIMHGTAGFDGYLIRVDGAWQTTLGWHTDELVGIPLVARVHPDDLNTVIAAFQTLCKGTGTIIFESRYRCQDSTYIWLTWHATPYLERLVIDLVVYAHMDRTISESEHSSCTPPEMRTEMRIQIPLRKG